MTEPELLPCPLCGGTRVDHKTRVFSHVRCHDCGAQSGSCDTPAIASRVWNARPEPEDAVRLSCDVLERLLMVASLASSAHREAAGLTDAAMSGLDDAVAAYQERERREARP